MIIEKRTIYGVQSARTGKFGSYLAYHLAEQVVLDAEGGMNLKVVTLEDQEVIELAHNKFYLLGPQILEEIVPVNDQDRLRIKAQALAKLSAEEREALGFPRSLENV